MPGIYLAHMTVEESIKALSGTILQKDTYSSLTHLWHLLPYFTYKMSTTTRKIGNDDVCAIGFGAMGLSIFYGTPKPDEERLKVCITPRKYP